MQAGFDLPFQPPSGDVNLLLAGQTAAPALKSSQAQTGNSNHGFFSIDAKEEKFWPVPLGQKPCTDKTYFKTLAVRPHDFEPLVNGLVSHFGLSDRLPSSVKFRARRRFHPGNRIRCHAAKGFVPIVGPCVASPGLLFLPSRDPHSFRCGLRSAAPPGLLKELCAYLNASLFISSFALSVCHSLPNRVIWKWEN